MIGAIAGAALGAASSIIGGISASRAMKKYKRQVEQQKRENEDWYNRRYNEDATQRADAQRILQMTEDSIRNRNRAAAGTQAVMGGTDESVAAAKAANNEALSQTMGTIAAQGEARKDAVEDKYLNRKDQLNQELQNIEQKKAQNISQAIKGVGGMAGNLGAMD